MFERYIHRCLIAGILILSILFPWRQAAADTSQCGEITTDKTWTAADNVHIIECNVFVNPGVTLTISEGSIVIFQIGTSLIIDDSLRIEGSEMDPVHLTSILDDSIGGDTNGNGSTTTPSQATGCPSTSGRPATAPTRSSTMPSSAMPVTAQQATLPSLPPRPPSRTAS
jgi:hypothetical protein